MCFGGDRGVPAASDCGLDTENHTFTLSFEGGRGNLYRIDTKSVDLNRDATPDARIPIEVDTFYCIDKKVTTSIGMGHPMLASLLRSTLFRHR